MLFTTRPFPRFGAVFPLALALALISAPPAAAEPPASVRQDLQAARAPEGQLERGDSDASLGARFYRFDQEVGGVPVLGAEAVVSDAPGDKGDLLVDDTHPDVDAPPDASVTRAAAIERARTATSLRELRGDIQAEQAILPEDSGGRLVWRVLVPAAKPLGDFEVLVDARSGETVRQRDLLVEAQGSAKIFLPNAVVENGGWSSSLVDDPGGVDDGDSDLLTSLRSQVTLERLDDGNCLTGAYVEVSGPTLPPEGACAPNRDFDDVTRRDDRFEAAMAYFHVDRTQDYIQRLGFTPANGNDIRGDRAHPAEVEVNVNVDTDEVPGDHEDNSFYSPVTKRVTLGDGAVDDGEDGEVIVHEYGHALQEDQVPYFRSSGETGAMGEGFGDYLAATTASQLPTATTEFNSCIFEWDTWGSARREHCLRRVDTSIGADTAEANCRGNTHCLGQAWSGALWDLRGLLGKDRFNRQLMDVLVLQSHFALTREASFDDGARALIFADRVLYGGGHEGALRYVLSDRKLLDPRRFDRDLSFRYSDGSNAFRGTLASAEYRCVSGQTVKVLKRRDGPDREIGSVTTGADGRYRVGDRKPDGRYYAKAPSSSLRPDTCETVRSDIRELG